MTGGGARKPTAPAGLGRDGRRLWRLFTGEYEFDARELQALEAACRQRDHLAQLEAHIDANGIVAKGSMGQLRISPMVTEARLARVALARLLGELALPGEELSDLDLVDNRTSAQRRASKAATRRWDNRRRLQDDRQRRRLERRGELHVAEEADGGA